MRFVCRKCEDFMLFEEVEGVRADSLGVTFGCPKCGARIAMVTNPGETQMVQALGVKLGGAAGAGAPLGLTRATLIDGVPSASNGKSHPVEASAPDGKPSAYAAPSGGPTAAAAEGTKGKCPFADMVAGMPGMDAVKAAASQAGAAPAAAAAAEQAALSPVGWSPEAKERLERVPSFVREMARLMIEQMARDAGRSEIDGSLMDAAKERFM